MKSKTIVGIAVAVTIMITFSFLKAEAVTLSAHNNPKQNDQEHEHWSIADLSDSLATLNQIELVFMNENSMIGTYVEVKKGESFQRKATEDDMYYLHNGTCSIQIGKQKKAFEQGDVVYVKAGSEFTVVDNKEHLQIVIVSMKLSSNSAKPKWKHFSKFAIESQRDDEENSWNPFIMYSNVMLGLYMLPHEMDGDGRLVHGWQELNVVTAGSSKFVMDSGTIDVGEGSIFFVEEGNGHYFTSLEDDIDILILWEQRDVDHSGY